MTEKPSRLVQFWSKAADELGFQIVAPFEVTLGRGAKLQVPLLVLHFGAKHGMLVVPSYETVKDVANELVEAGYGFSVLSEPESHDDYVREEYIEVLRDWGWSGEPSGMPLWLC
jgi:hypothetical protein